jgi:putative ABC transport system permease protein
MDRLGQDFRVALRGIRRTPAFAMTIVVILAVGIGMAAAMASLYEVVLRERLPVIDQEHLIVPRPIDRGGVQADPSMRDIDQLDRQSRTMRGVASVWHYGALPSPMLSGDRSVVLQRVIVSANFFDVLGARPALGRLLRREDGASGAAGVLVLSYDTWRLKFGGDSSIVGRRLTEGFTRSAYAVVGVAPAGLDFPAGAEAWFASPPEFSDVLVQTIARVAPNATIAEARAEYLRFMQDVDRKRGVGAVLIGASTPSLGTVILGDARPILTVLAAAVGLLLLIACVNVGNLLLLRAVSRTREIAVRRAVGARYADIVRQLLVESGLLGAAGGIAGIVIAGLLVQLLIAVAPGQLPRMDVLRLAGTPVGLAVVITIVAVLLFGLAPALVAARADIGTVLRADTRSGRDSIRGRRVRQLLVAAQTALAVIMIAAAGLLARSLGRLQEIDLGYRPEHLSVFAITYPASVYDSLPKLFALGAAIDEKLRAVAGVTAVSPIVAPPFLGPSLFITKLATDAQTDEQADADPYIPWEVAGPDYFRTLGTPLLRGRGFTTADREGAPNVAIVSQALARRLWPGENPIGKHLRAARGGPSAQWTVIGMAGDTHYRVLREATPVIYMPWRQMFWAGYFAIRSRAPIRQILPSLERAAQTVDPRVTLWRAQSMDELLAEPLARPRLSTFLLSAFSVVALFLAAMGLYGMTASTVRDRAREMGIRIALGATPGRLRRDILGAALGTTAAGAVVGLTAALAMSGLLASLLFEVRPTDPIALLGACGVLLVVALAAAYFPARRATTIDPARALREE